MLSDPRTAARWFGRRAGERQVVKEAPQAASQRSSDERAVPDRPGRDLERSIEEADRDAADVRAAAAGDRRAFDALVVRHQQAVLDAAVYFLGDWEDALEVAQETFLKAYQALARFRGEARFRTWVLRIALNTARSYHARRSAKKRSAPLVSLHAATSSASAEGAVAELEVADSAGDPLALLERKEVKEALEQAIGRLEEEARELVVLRDIIGEPYEAIAAARGLPVGTVKSKVHRARLVLREKMAPYLGCE
jgi:RNA polymerase sigma-70 factor (ECF subfamily)